MATTKWVIDPMHSELQFKVKHLVISTVTGSFKSFTGEAETEGEDFENAKVQFSADIASIDTGQEGRDEHLKGADFFDAAQYPQLTFESTSMTKTDDDEYKLVGNLTLHGVTKPVTLNVEFGGATSDFYGNFKAGFDVTGKISRKEYGLTWSGVTDAGSVVVGDEVKLVASVQFTKQA
jgi:polyisoprenoid-binding protein YceI